MGKRGSSVLLISILIISNISFVLALNEYTLDYDSNGNLISGFGLNHSYNDLNQLIKTIESDIGDTISEYFYDHEGTRIKKIDFHFDGSNTTTYYVDDNFIQIVNSSGVFNETYYYQGKDLIAKKDNSGNTNFYHPDQLGSTTLVTNESGNIVEEEIYLPYGDTLEGNEGSRFLFTGQEKDSETGIYYYGARYYDPFLRHFIQPDDILPEIYDPQQLNRYSYARNNPYKYVDSSGNYIDTVIDVAFIGYDIYSIIQNPKDSTNYISLALDVGGAAIPFVTGFGTGFRIAKGANKAENLGDAFRFLDNTDEIVKGKDFIGFRRLFQGDVVSNIGQGEKLFSAGSVHEARNFVRGQNLPKEVSIKGNKFFSDATTKGTRFEVEKVGDEYLFEYFSPANKFGYGKLFNLRVDKQGQVLKRVKHTTDIEGNILKTTEY